MVKPSPVIIPSCGVLHRAQNEIRLSSVTWQTSRRWRILPKPYRTYMYVRTYKTRFLWYMNAFCLKVSWLESGWMPSLKKQFVSANYCEDNGRLGSMTCQAGRLSSYVLDINFLTRACGSTSTLINRHDLVPKLNSIRSSKVYYIFPGGLVSVMVERK